MATRTRLSLSSLSALLVAAPAVAAIPQLAPDQVAQIRAQESARAQASTAHVMGLRAQAGLDNDSTIHQAAVHTDSFGQTHTYVQQHYKGVRVWGGDAIVHMDKNGAFRPMTSALKANISLNTMPSLRSEEALAIVHQDLAPAGAYHAAPSAELVVFPVMAQTHVGAGNDATAYEQQVVRYALAYHVQTDLQNGEGETKQMNYMIDAHTGAILKSWNNLHTAGAVGTGNSQYSGTVSLNTNSTTSGYELRDTTRATVAGTFGVGNVVTNLNHATTGNGTVYTNSTNTWGDGQNYINGGSTTNANGQTAAVDAAFGIQCTWDMYKNVLGRNGIDGAGKSSYLRVHYSSSYDNAFWDDSCFCMTFGDGSQFKSLTCVDVAGHEMSHGVIANSVPGGLNYSGEAGGLNESNSDIFGTMVEFYDLGGGEAAQATTVPATGGNWTIGEQLETASFNHPLRYMYKPSLDGSSPDAWSSTIGSLDVHYSSGPGNREFYFLSQGASSSSTSDYYSSYTPNGFSGVGNDHAARIHYRAMTTYYTSTTNYAQARTAHLNAASDLYGANSAEYAAVQNSFAAVNVGSAAPAGVTVTISPSSASVSTNATQQFSATVSGSTNTSVTWTTDGGSVSTSGLYTAPATAGTFHVTATSQADTTKSATATVTVTAPAALSASITTPSGNVTVGSGVSQSFAGSASGGTSPYTYSWTFGDGASATTASASHAYTNTGTSNATYTATFTVTDSKGATSSASRTITVTPASSGGQEQIVNGGFESGTTGWTETAGVIGANGPSEPAHSGSYNAWLDGYGSSHTDYIYQTITVPASGATLSFYLHIDTAETTTTTAYDTLKIQVLNTAGTVLGTLGTYSNLNAASGYTLRSFNLGAYAGQTVRIRFYGVEDVSLQTSFVVDDVSAK